MKRTTRKAGSNASWKVPAPGQIRVYVWEWPVRFSHWVMVITIISLSITGYYMHAPYVAAGGRTAYVMGTMRFVHIVSGFAFMLAILIRMYWFFFANRWSRWNQYIPTTKKRMANLVAVGKYYGFMAWSPVRYIGHNPMAGAAYAVVYAMAIVEIITGLALYSQILGSKTLSFFVGWIPHFIDIQWLREIHFLIMFGFWMFFIHHIYTAILVSVEEENGLMDSIFSGYKFVPKQELLRDPAVEEQQPDVETVQAVSVEEEESHTAV
ncbi:Ni/Fe-hydrogenase 1 B-type cytochrome subunit [Silvibacterium bohemicum]|uniref:Ni/Fe-hydrogenase 1 B-type cytochrome subunit n=1 Tax=Silvibacterium bohemicum TaxID=1577686 RepID=A0A841JXX0_9BACT|nr:Ni/Fe-hydrogenase, b-type cytochrome subunit [Silvibacterium bohemicum]MBB6143831.1 Ni/Fe-hydrogenase 1 B-type cytochrome subunit [Silvibacterium bohemicum]